MLIAKNDDAKFSLYQLIFVGTTSARMEWKNFLNNINFSTIGLANKFQDRNKFILNWNLFLLQHINMKSMLK